MTREELEKRLEEVCNDHCDGCPLRKECEAYQAGEKEEITAETLKAGMTFEGVNIATLQEYKPKRPRGRQPWDGLPALMMADHTNKKMEG